ncbi:MAG: hypothetical protein GX883_08850 [Firmicutes bacterium]|nr:hypothetical protein [Bacillota bacterium]
MSTKANPGKVRQRTYFANRDLLVMAVLSGIGGVLSTYVGYLGNLLNRIFGVPFGAGQFVSGLHVFWIILAAGLVRRPGAAAIAGLLKGVVELLTGSTHGIAIVLVSLVQGIVVDLVILLMRRHGPLVYAVAGGLAAVSNVVVFQLLYFSGAPLGYILFVCGLALVSGCLLAGLFGSGVLDLIAEAGLLRLKSGREAAEAEAGWVAERGRSGKPAWVKIIVVFVLIVAFSAGAIYYFAVIFEPPWGGPQCRVEGEVERELSFSLARFADLETTITAELKGEVTHVPPQEYTGIPVKEILREAAPLPGASVVKVIATDGYEVEFALDEVMADTLMVLLEEDGGLRLIAGNYAGGYWVKLVSRFRVE